MNNIVIAGHENFKNKLFGANVSQEYFCSDTESHVYNMTDAYRVIESNNIDLIFMDISDKKKEGIEFLKKVKSDISSACIVLVDSEPDFECARNAIIYEAFDYLIMPVDQEKLSGVFRRYLSVKHPYIKDDEKFAQEIFISSLLRGDTENIHIKLKNYINTVAAETEYMKINDARIRVIDITHSISEAIYKEHIWIDKFIQDLDIYKINILSCDNTNEIMDIFEEYLNETVEFIKRFMLISKNKSVRSACRFILEHADEKLCLERVAKNCFLNKSYLSHIFKEDAGISFVEYVTMIKIELAKKMFRETDMMVFETAAALSFENTEYFSRKFKDYVGITPNTFKKKYHDNIKSRAYLGA